MLFYILINYFKLIYPGENAAKSYSNNERIKFTNFYLTDSLFSNLTSSLNGGSLDLSDTFNLNLLIKFCIFSYCSSINSGGAIYFSCSNGACVLNYCCGYFCYATGNNWDKGGQFSYIQSSTSKNNSLLTCSITKCSPNIFTFLSNSIFLLKGNQKVEYLNSSYNFATIYAGFHCYLHTFINVLYNNFYNNTASDHNIIFFRESPGKISSTNIIENYASFRYGVFTVQVTTINVDNCIFLRNFGILFDIPNGNIIIINSFIDIFSSTRLPGSISTSNIITANYTSLLFNYFSTVFCENNNNLTFFKSNQILNFVFILQFLVYLTN